MRQSRILWHREVVKEIAVVGGGISGLLVAYFLLNRGERVRLFEAGERLGGWLQSENIDGDWVEWGPNTLMAGNLWREVFRDLKLNPIRPSGKSRARYIYRESGLQALSPSLLFSGLNWMSRGKILADLLGSRDLLEDDLSISDFFQRYLGSEITTEFVDAFVGGVFAGKISELSARSCFPKLWGATKTRGSLIRGIILQRRTEKLEMISFSRGLSELIDAFLDRIGASSFLRHPVREISKEKNEWSLKTPYGTYRADQIVLTCPSFEAAHLLRAHSDRSAISDLENIRYQRMMVWNTCFTRPLNFRGGFGVLIPRKFQKKLLGSLWSTEIFSERANSNRLVTSQFYAGESIPADPESDLPLLQKILDVQSKPLWSRFRTYERAIPQFELNHQARVKNIREKIPQGIHLAGNYLDSVGLSGLIQTAYNVAEKIRPSF